MPSFSAAAAGSTPPLSQLEQAPAAAQGSAAGASSSQASASAEAAVAADGPAVQQRHTDSGDFPAAPEAINQTPDTSATLNIQVSAHAIQGRQEPVQATIAVTNTSANSDDVQLLSESVNSQASTSAVPAQGQFNCHAPDVIFIIDMHASEIL